MPSKTQICPIRAAVSKGDSVQCFSLVIVLRDANDDDDVDEEEVRRNKRSVAVISL